MDSLLDLSNRRRARRVRENLEVEIFGDDLHLLKGQTINLSASGARLLMKNPPAGRHFFLKVEIDGRSIETLADKVWENRNGASGGTVIGLQFSSLRPADQQRLLYFCDSKSQKAAEAKRPQRIRLSIPLS